MESLNQLALKYGTDKSSGGHDYCKIYEQYLEPCRNKIVSVIEVGVGGYESEDRGGESLRMWYHYFKNGKIIGIDIHNKLNLINDRTEFWQGSQTDEHLFKTILEREKNAEIRIVIDDASHINELTIQTFKLIFPLLKSGDIYIVEDVHTSYFEKEYNGSRDINSPNTSMNYFNQLTHQLNDREIDKKYHNEFSGTISYIHFYQEVIIIKKK